MTAIRDRPGGEGEQIQLRAGELKQAPVRDWLIRFGFGAGVSALAGVVSVVAGPRVGGVFLAFPAILLASLTLVAKEDGARQARNEARGATLGTLGLVGFAAVVAITLPGWPLWAALGAAIAVWTLVALGSYFIARRAGAGGDESPGT
jgi:hypothetical protein